MSNYPPRSYIPNNYINENHLKEEISEKINNSIKFNNIYQYPFQRRYPTSNELLNILNFKFIHNYLPFVNDMVLFLSNNILNSNTYFEYLSNYQAPDSEFQTMLLNVVPKFDPINQPFRVQMVTISGMVFADNFYDGNYGDVSQVENNVYNNPEILQSILYGCGGMRRCVDGQTQSLRIAFGVENDYGTTVLTRILYDIPE